MSANFDYWRKLVDSPLPFYQDTQAGTGATRRPLAGYPTAQDTGWTRGDFTPRMEDGPGSAFAADGAGGAGRFGYDYSGAAPGYNAWALFDDGTQDGGWYNAAADTQQWDSGRGDGTTETSRRRVWRWTLDDLHNTDEWKAARGDANKVPVEVVNRLFLANVARLHRDFDANGSDWQQSGFANFDRVLPAGGTGVNPNLPRQDVPPAGGPTGNPPGYGSDPNSFGGTGGIETAYQDQAFRTAQLLKALGLGDINSRLSYGGSLIARQAPKLFEAWREAQGIGGQGVPNGMGQLGAFANVYNSPGAMGNIAQTGQNALGWLMGQGGQGLSDQELIPLIQGFEQLANIRQSDTMQNYFGNLTDQGLGQFLQGLNPSNIGTSRLVPFLRGNPLFGFLTGKR